MIRVCAWCRRVLDTVPPPEEDTNETHGICPQCRAGEEQRVEAADAGFVAIVRHQQPEMFQNLRERLRELKVADVIWDRRVGERRALAGSDPSDRRRSDRRAAPPITWSALGFLVAHLGRADQDRAVEHRAVPCRQAKMEEAKTVEEMQAAEVRELPVVDARQRLARWAEEGQHVVRAIPAILAEHDRWKARAEAAEQECERLRQEIDQVGETVRRVMSDSLQPLNETLQRLRSPQRRPATDA
jgi:hypothetical protein